MDFVRIGEQIDSNDIGHERGRNTASMTSTSYCILNEAEKRGNGPRRPAIKVVVTHTDGTTTKLPFIIDSGATISVLSYSDYRLLGNPNISPLPKEANIIAGNRTKLVVIWSVDLDINICGTAQTQRFHVSKGIKNTLLGYDAIVGFDPMIHSEGYTTRKQVKYIIPPNNVDNPVRIQDNLIIKAGDVCGVNAKAQLKSDLDHNFDSLVEGFFSSNGPPKVGVIAGLYRAKAGGNFQLMRGQHVAYPLLMRRLQHFDKRRKRVSQPV